MNAPTLNQLLAEEKDLSTDVFSYMLLACQHGLDCSGTADWIWNLCEGNVRCDTTTGPNLIESFAGPRWPDVQRRAAEIDTALSNGDWQAAGLEPSKNGT
jgi:hypothetical protein